MKQPHSPKESSCQTEDEAVHASPHDRLLYPVPVLYQLGQTGALGTQSNPYESPVEVDTVNVKQRSSNSKRLPWLLRVVREERLRQYRGR